MLCTLSERQNSCARRTMRGSRDLTAAAASRPQHSAAVLNKLHTLRACAERKVPAASVSPAQAPHASAGGVRPLDTMGSQLVTGLPTSCSLIHNERPRMYSNNRDPESRTVCLRAWAELAGFSSVVAMPTQHRVRPARRHGRYWPPALPVSPPCSNGGPASSCGCSRPPRSPAGCRPQPSQESAETLKACTVGRWLRELPA